MERLYLLHASEFVTQDSSSSSTSGQIARSVLYYTIPSEFKNLGATSTGVKQRQIFAERD